MSERIAPASPGNTGAMSLVARRLVVVVVVLVVGLGVFMLAAAWLTVDGSGSGSAVQIEIMPGADTAQIATQLRSSGVIGNVVAFRVFARVMGADGQLKSGVYDFKTGMPISAVVGLLRSGPTVEYSAVTIPEGFVIDQIAERLEKQAGIPRAEFEGLAKTGAARFAKDHPYLAGAYKGSLEGYLFPKTYRIRAGSSASEVIEMMLNQFDAEIVQVDVGSASAGGLNLNQLVTLASMIERESRLDSERPLISSVIHNRLRTDSFLKIDATIQYVLGNNRFRLTNQDIKIDSPYNTYTRKGLPPGPISNPGLKSLKAAAEPAKTDLLYYVLTGKDGSHTFTTNLADFLAAKKKSKRVFGE